MHSRRTRSVSALLGLLLLGSFLAGCGPKPLNIQERNQKEDPAAQLARKQKQGNE